MNRRTPILGILAALCSAAPAGAVRTPPFTTVQEANCQRAIAAAATRTVDAALRAWARCYKDEGRGYGDCAAITVRTSSDRGRVVTVCRQVATFANLGLGASVPAAADAVIANALARSGEIADAIYGLTYGSSDNGGLSASDPALYRCLNTLGTVTKRLPRVRSRENTRCLDADDRQQAIDPSRLPACNETRRHDRATAADLADGLASSCTPAQILAATGEGDAAAAAQKIAALVDRSVCDAYPNAGSLNVCGGGISIRTVGGAIELGWKGGSNHGQAVPESLPSRADLRNCTGSGTTTCQISSAVAGQVRSVTPVAAPDRACLVTTLTGDLTGSITFTGALASVQSLDLGLPQRIDVYIAGSPPAQPCPTCSGAGLGDAGTCAGGPSDGQPCVVDGSYGALGNTSADCLPPAGAKFASIVPDITSASTGPHALAATLPCEGFTAQGFLCHCPGQEAPNACNAFTCGANEHCTLNGSRLCFPDPIVRNGSTAPITLSAIGCAASASAPLQTIVGLPGPIAVDFEVEVALVP